MTTRTYQKSSLKSIKDVQQSDGRRVQNNLILIFYEPWRGIGSSNLEVVLRSISCLRGWYKARKNSYGSPSRRFYSMSDGYHNIHRAEATVIILAQLDMMATCVPICIFFSVLFNHTFSMATSPARLSPGGEFRGFLPPSSITGTFTTSSLDLKTLSLAEP
ncbi:hypothetical protein CPC08DRAFT_302506 [Agrocybe pediades]|nr:hypothetical protein CPC08DRAFT_302506 [Agrocybe pediades]